MTSVPFAPREPIAPRNEGTEIGATNVTVLGFVLPIGRQSGVRQDVTPHATLCMKTSYCGAELCNTLLSTSGTIPEILLFIVSYYLVYIVYPYSALYDLYLSTALLFFCSILFVLYITAHFDFIAKVITVIMIGIIATIF